ncbi:hypothetical protein ECHHL_0334 [Ehrlichia chaffeensis str. Heartland]|nr:hypothetical protein ECHHL_0334 [Ehrlichia chaffeensis str. Heartland]AHX05780.1 hypothetical protein ECHJAX_0723 [Ehrlichia chaffeensis str. Jax]AHX06772.1 hypothetical protein ECHLIB_0727 [Ehrlichia chaffeensis str. Liberty]AHX07571.1 hypothetical protein ECHOSC_0342 [Ehrlichia chaffeensis str. Osceola]AHX08983.1 hypothetical protein ECHSTV_0713 [Ehrlichia chaffeensis str. Saint Vincent]AHX09532.1 hypothetical protein ECHWAK_0720 [Ehrlichia chaffeensis str. Wakulla]AHX10954.1 hypothetica
MYTQAHQKIYALFNVKCVLKLYITPCKQVINKYQSNTKDNSSNHHN